MTESSITDVKKHFPIVMITPISPPYGGLANQTSLLLNSKIFNTSYDVITVKSNTRQLREDPAQGKTGYLHNFMFLLKHVFITMKTHSCSVIMLRTNGDVSFLRDMLSAVAASIWFRKPLVVHLHASRLGFWTFSSVESLSGHRPGIINRLKKHLGYWLAAVLLKRSHSFSQLTVEIDRFYHSLGFKQADIIIPNATTPMKVDFAEKDGKSILFVGRLSEEKGILDLLKAMELVKTSNWTLNLLGPSANIEDQEEINRILAHHPYKERIFFRGVITGAQKWDYFLKSSIVVLPSYLEVFPNVLLEGMTTGNAIVSTNVGEVESLARSGGIHLVSPGDPIELSHNLEHLLSNSSLVRKMGMANLDYSSDFHVERIAELFSQSIVTALDRFKSTR